jgi:hypothetical protein
MLGSTVTAGFGFYMYATVVTFGVSGLAVWRGFRPVDSLVERWAKAHDLELDEAANRLVSSRLRQGRRIRTIGFVVGYSWPWFVLIFTGHAGLFLRSVLPVRWWNIGGYFLAAAIAEAWFARSSPGTGSALLERRTLADYLPAPARFGPRLLAGLGAVAAVTYSLLPRVENPQGLAQYLRSDRFISASACLWAAVWVGGLVIGIELLQHAVVRRRQQQTSETMIRADDSLRAWSIRILAGISLTVTSGIVAWLVWLLAIRIGAVTVDWTWGIHGITSVVVGAACFRRLSRPLVPWRVPRAVIQPT